MDRCWRNITASCFNLLQRLFYALLILLALWSSAAAQDRETRTLNADSLLIESILIVGNERTKEAIIRREMQLREGDYFDVQVAERDRQRILNLRLFHQVILQPLKGETGLVVCVIVTERWYIFPVPILFVNNKDWDKLSYGGALTWENVWGRNVTATGSVWFGFNRDARIRYHDPWMFATRGISFDGTIYSSRMPNISVDYPEFDVIRNGMQITLGLRKGYHTTFYVMAGYQRVELPNQRQLSLSGERFDHLPQIGMQVVYDRRDYNAYAKQGWYLLLSALMVQDGGPVHFGRLKWDVRRYQPLTTSVSLAGRTCFEIAAGNLPVYEHLLLGQETRVRGHFYDLYEGENRLIAGLECRLPIIPIKYLDVDESAALSGSYGQNLPVGISAGFFLDTGAIWYRDQDIRRVPFYTGYGLGLHLHLPYIELLRLERAWDMHGRGQYIIDLKAWF
ncbi:BamA/TamA family outer membrane protein [candidate division KSB1 bacterium]|nr:BamA/TamA family outer membrane protein [candidate division KSB1 bacterium]